MRHLELFSSSIASGVITPLQLNYVATGALLPGQVNGMQVSPDLPYVHSIFGVGANLATVRMQTSSMSIFPYPNFAPNNRGSAFESPPRHWDLGKNPFPVKPTEEFDIFATQNSGGAQTEYVAVQFCDGPDQPIATQINPPALRDAPTTPGRYLTAHATSGTTLAAGGWTDIQPAFDSALYAGFYALVGIRVFSATGLFFRIKPAMGFKWWPGGICVQTYDQLDPPGQRFYPGWAQLYSNWGPWVSFYQNIPPRVSIFATAADTAEEFWYDLIYLGPQTTPAI
jgi:hypothetical protein